MGLNLITQIIMRNSLLFFISLLLTGCVAEVMEESVIHTIEHIDNENVRTRSGGQTAYYWCHDQKVYLPVAEDSYFAVFRSSTLHGLSKLSSLNVGVEFKEYDFNSSSTRGETEEKFLWARVDSEIAQAYSDEIVISLLTLLALRMT